ncbi:MAG TPA: OmpA family protein [Gemmatimonadaceae bacterium]
MKAVTFVPLALLVTLASPTQAQFGKLKEKMKQRVEQGVDRATDKALDKAESKVKCAWDDKACIDQAKGAGKEVEITGGGAASQAGTPASASAGAAAAAPGGKAPSAKPGEGAWSNFDFVPGERVLFAEDFSRDRVGNFPKRLELATGNAEVVEWQGKRWLRVNDYSVIEVPLPEALPQRFTIEFDYTLPWSRSGFYIAPKADLNGTSHNYSSHTRVELHGTEAGIIRAQNAGESKADPRDYFKDMYDNDRHLSEPIRVRLQADGRYVKVYLNEVRVANMPNADFPRADKLVFFFDDNTYGEKQPPLLTNLSINAGGKDLYDALMADGRVTTQGIYFDTGSDHIRPESSGTLREIADMLREHPELKVTIEGHTDNVGDAAANQALSEQRAAAVKAALSAAPYGIDAARFATKGLGAVKPKAPNTSPEGRQQNRRVELVKM